MATVGTRELKQNPQAVIGRVLETGEPVEVTSYGRPTGVSLVPDARPRQMWVPSRALARVRPLGEANRRAWHADLETLRDEDEIMDPWAGRA